MELKKEQIINFLKTQKLMVVATSGDFPWIANVYFTFDDNLNIYFFSDPNTLHCRQIAQNSTVAVSIVDSHQDVSQLKRGLQISGIAEQISDMEKVKQSLKMWKEALGIKTAKSPYWNCKATLSRCNIKLLDKFSPL